MSCHRSPICFTRSCSTENFNSHFPFVFLDVRDITTKDHSPLQAFNFFKAISKILVGILSTLEKKNLPVFISHRTKIFLHGFYENRFCKNIFAQQEINTSKFFFSCFFCFVSCFCGGSGRKIFTREE